MRVDIDRMFAMLGQRAKNGRIKKNEKYTLKEFVNVAFPTYVCTRETDLTWYDRAFKTQRYKDARMFDKFFFYEELKQKFKMNLIRLIEEDDVGRKR